MVFNSSSPTVSLLFDQRRPPIAALHINPKDIIGMEGEILNRLKMTGIFSIVTISLILTGCAQQKKIISRDIRFPSPQMGVVKAMTFNIRVGTAWWDGANRWSKRRQNVVETIKRNSADIIGLQEALDFQLEHIQQALPQYSTYAAGRNNGRQKGEACPIFYRKDRFRLADSGTFWFSDTPDVPGTKDWGNIPPRICSWVRLRDKASGKGFYVYNLHLDNLSQRSRAKSVRLLASRIAARKTKDPFIVMGDFNMELDNPAMKFLQKIENQGPYPTMVDAWSSIYPGDSSIGTRHNFSGRSSGPKIDHIPISWDARALAVNIDRRGLNGRYPSDHFPVIATIRIF